MLSWTSGPWEQMLVNGVPDAPIFVVSKTSLGAFAEYQKLKGDASLGDVRKAVEAARDKDPQEFESAEIFIVESTTDNMF